MEVSFLYGPEHQRIRETSSRTVGGVTTRKTLNVLHPDNEGSLYFEREDKTLGSVSSSENRHYISAEKGAFLLITSTNAIQSNPVATAQTGAEQRYWHKDHLGSIVASTNASGGVIERMAYDPFGKRQHIGGQFDQTGSIDASSTSRGFTGHEHLDELDFIHMNARVYDPDIGKFLSADPKITYVHNPQGFNRYAYTQNNPLNFVDPDGFDLRGRDTTNNGYNGAPAASTNDTDGKPDNTNLARGKSSSAAEEKPNGGKGTAGTHGNILAQAMDRWVDANIGTLSAQQRQEALVHGYERAIAGGDNASAYAIASQIALNGGAAMVAAVGPRLKARGNKGPGLNAKDLTSNNARVPEAAAKGVGRLPGPATDKAGNQIGRIIVDSKGNAMIEPAGGKTVPAGNGGVDTHTLYPNGSNYQRLNPQGHANNSTPHGHGHAPGTGPGMRGQGPSLDVNGNVVPWNSPAAHWPIK